jgi:hypothetical protein
MDKVEEFRRREVENLIRYMPTVLAEEMNKKQLDTNDVDINMKILEEIENYFQHLSKFAQLLVDEKSKNEFETFLSTVSISAPKSG